MNYYAVIRRNGKWIAVREDDPRAFDSCTLFPPSEIMTAKERAQKFCDMINREEREEREERKAAR